MQRAFMVAALSLTMGFSACSKNKSAEKAADVPNQPEQSAWMLKQQSTCAEGVAVESCKASQGFSVDAEGKFVVGPAANGKTLTGQITAEELASLKQALIAAEMIPAEGQASVSGVASEQRVEMISENKDVITLQLNGQDAKQVIQTNGTELVFLTTASEAQAIESAAGHAQALQTALATLVETYYPETFPNLCMDKVEEITANLYPSFNACETDADCSYVNYQDDSAIPEGTHQFVITDNGDYLPPLIVANSSSLANAELGEKLRAAYENVNSVCGTFARPDFTEMKGFYADQAAPVCAARAEGQAKVCQVNPSITF
jgi:hypothetical protein